MPISLIMFIALVGGILIPFISYVLDRKRELKSKRYYIQRAMIFASSLFIMMMIMKPILTS